MTIRLRCAECQRKLKVPDEALGKKVQCPSCGARFIGRLETNSTPPPPLETPPAIEPFFQDMEPAPVEEAAAPLSQPESLAIEEAVSAPTEPALSSFPNLQLDEVPPIEPIEPFALDEPIAEEPVVVEEAVPAEEPIGIEEVVDVEEAEVTEEAVSEDDAVDPIVMEEEPVMDVTTVADETDAVDVVDEAEEGVEPEIVDEDEAAEEAKPKTRKKKSRGLLCGCLAALALLLPMVGAGGFFGYRWWTGYISDDDWKTVVNPAAQCSIAMPGTATPSTEPVPQLGTQIEKFAVEKPWARSEFLLQYQDVANGSVRGNALDERIQATAAKLSSQFQGTVEATRPISLGTYQGRETRLRLGSGRYAVVRIYLAPRQQQTRVYELRAIGPDMKSSDGPGSRFFNSFQILQGASGPQPGPGARR